LVQTVVLMAFPFIVALRTGFKRILPQLKIPLGLDDVTRRAVYSFTTHFADKILDTMCRKTVMEDKIIKFKGVVFLIPCRNRQIRYAIRQPRIEPRESGGIYYTSNRGNLLHE
jgi:hypothetical protein